MKYLSKKRKVSEVVGEGLGQVLLEMDVILKDVDPFVNNPILEEKFEIHNLDKHIFRDQVVLQGTLVKNIIYKGMVGQRGVTLHETVSKPFTIQVPIPGLRRGRKIGQRVIFSPDPLDDVDVQVHLLGIESDTRIRTEEDEVADCKNDDQAQIIFRNPCLSPNKHGSKGKMKKKPCHCKDRQNGDLLVHEKVLIRVLVIASKDKFERVPICMSQPVCKCICKNNTKRFRCL